MKKTMKLCTSVFATLLILFSFVTGAFADRLLIIDGLSKIPYR